MTTTSEYNPLSEGHEKCSFWNLVLIDVRKAFDRKFGSSNPDTQIFQLLLLCFPGLVVVHIVSTIIVLLAFRRTSRRASQQRVGGREKEKLYLWTIALIITDSLTLYAGVVRFIGYTIRLEIRSEFFHNYATMIVSACALASHLVLMSMTIDRSVAILTPFWYRSHSSQRRCWAAIGPIALVSLALSFGTFWGPKKPIEKKENMYERTMLNPKLDPLCVKTYLPVFQAYRDGLFPPESCQRLTAGFHIDNPPLEETCNFGPTEDDVLAEIAFKCAKGCKKPLPGACSHYHVESFVSVLKSRRKVFEHCVQRVDAYFAASGTVYEQIRNGWTTGDKRFICDSVDRPQVSLEKLWNRLRIGDKIIHQIQFQQSSLLLKDNKCFKNAHNQYKRMGRFPLSDDFCLNLTFGDALFNWFLMEAGNWKSEQSPQSLHQPLTTGRLSLEFRRIDSARLRQISSGGCIAKADSEYSRLIRYPGISTNHTRRTNQEVPPPDLIRLRHLSCVKEEVTCIRNIHQCGCIQFSTLRGRYLERQREFAYLSILGLIFLVSAVGTVVIVRHLYQDQMKEQQKETDRRKAAANKKKPLKELQENNESIKEVNKNHERSRLETLHKWIENLCSMLSTNTEMKKKEGKTARIKTTSGGHLVATWVTLTQLLLFFLQFLTSAILIIERSSNVVHNGLVKYGLVDPRSSSLIIDRAIDHILISAYLLQYSLTALVTLSLSGELRQSVNEMFSLHT